MCTKTVSFMSQSLLAMYKMYKMVLAMLVTDAEIKKIARWLWKIKYL